MKSALLLAAGLLWPIASSAGVRVEVSVGAPAGEIDECDYEPSWFEEGESDGPFEVSFEYQWFNDDGRQELRFRRICYNTFFDTWQYGPWVLRAGFCYPGCHLDHVHHFYYSARPYYIRHFGWEQPRGQWKRHCGYYVEYRSDNRPDFFFYHHRNWRGGDDDRGWDNGRRGGDHGDRHPEYRHEEYRQPKYRHDEPARAQPPVRRPSVRPVPQVNQAPRPLMKQESARPDDHQGYNNGDRRDSQASQAPVRTTARRTVREW